MDIGDFLCPCCGQGADIVKPELITILNRVQTDYGRPFTITSGYRCGKHNRKVGGAPNSPHMAGEAGDIGDADGEIKRWMTEDMLAIYGLWAEDYNWTLKWLHLQCRPASQRIFIP